MQFYGSQLSQHISRTPEGYILCLGVPLARTAVNNPQLYRGAELGLPTDDTVEVFRAESEVFNKKFLASLESKPVTDRHPGQFLSPDNYAWHSRGHVRNIRSGDELPDGELAVVGDLVITDPTLAEKILSGQQREVSVGYDCEYVPRGDGSYEQTKLRANHVAIVSDGRAGEHVRIYDASAEESFAAQCRRYHRRNPAQVVAAGERRAADRMPEFLRMGAPYSWDELGEIHEQLTEGEGEMAKPDTSDEQRLAQVLSRLTDVVRRLEERAEPKESESVETDDSAEGQALLHLRLLRSAIERSADRKAIDTYNSAVKDLKRRIRDRRVVSDTRTPAQRVEDAELLRRFGAEVNPDSSFGEMARSFHRRDARKGQEAYTEMSRKMGAGFARTSDSEEDYETLIARRRRELLGRK